MSENAYEKSLVHYGTPRRSGRYPWGSGSTPEARNTSFLASVSEMKKQGLSESEVAKGVGMNTKQLRAAITIAGNAKKQADISMAEHLKNDKQMSNVAAAKQMGIPESTFRGLLAPGVKDRADVLNSTADMLRNRVGPDKFVDVGKGVGNQMGIAKTKLDTSVAMLEHEGYRVLKVNIPQVGGSHETQTKVLCPPGTTWKDVVNNQHRIIGFKDFTNDGGRSWQEVVPPTSVSSKRLQILYKKDGGDKADGVIYVRPGAHDLDMGGTHYAQVRILVDGTHYLKGMAVLKHDLPPGVDLQFHTNKNTTGNKLDALKPVNRLANGKVDHENPFGASIGRQIFDHHGKLKSHINLVNEETNWDDWSRNLASQFLSKQRPELIKSQLDVTYARKKDQLNEILALTNPTVKERLLRSYADDMDASAVHLKAAAMPRQKTHVILPINSLKEHEVYAPGFRHGETVVLVRYPHGGPFEIPTLTVNNRNAMGRRLIHPDATAAIGINHKVAARLSGADFDGDTVVVIPNNSKRIATQHPLPGLKGFDPQHSYPGYAGMKKMKNTQTEMGKISNLITDMTIKGAPPHELAAAVRHSMVVIDAEKKGLNYKLSAERNGIAALRKKYQPGKYSGAHTLLSRSTGERDVPEYKPRPASQGGPIDRKTGRLVFVPTGKTKSVRTVDKNTGEVTYVPKPKTVKAQRGAVTVDKNGHPVPVHNAHSLIEGEGMPVERMYADYSNRVRSLANQARLEMVHNTKPLPYSPSAKTVYHKEVASLNAKLDKALKEKPLERQAQVVANVNMKLKKQANPNLYSDKDLLKKTEAQTLKSARHRVGKDKYDVDITDAEWTAIQHGAITHTKLKEILDNANVDKVKQLATPRTTVAMTTSKLSRARALAAAGYTQSDIADELGVSVSTLRRGLSDK